MVRGIYFRTQLYPLMTRHLQPRLSSLVIVCQYVLLLLFSLENAHGYVRVGPLIFWTRSRPSSPILKL